MEKKSESELSFILKDFNQSYIYFSPNENKHLKEIFSQCSKQNTNLIGYPDRIYFDNKTLLVFECKAHNIYNREFIIHLGYN